MRALLVVLFVLGLSAPAVSALGSSSPPPACSAVATSVSTAPAGKAVDLWVQCDYGVERLRFSAVNRRVLAIVGQPELLAPEPGNYLVCRYLGKTKGGACTGGLSSRSRMRVRLRLDRPVCEHPRVQLVIRGKGGTECPSTGQCTGVGAETTTLTSNDRRTLVCSR
jgi:hypothetical protein